MEPKWGAWWRRHQPPCFIISHARFRACLVITGKLAIDDAANTEVAGDISDVKEGVQEKMK